jgi:hypothetical protein
MGQTQGKNKGTNSVAPGAPGAPVTPVVQGTNSSQPPSSAPTQLNRRVNSTRVGGNRKRRCWKKNVRGGMATVHWDQIPMRQPSNDVMEKATTAPRSLIGGRRRSHKRRGHKKSHKAKRHHHHRSKRHHRKGH